jgi:hypothetical protein
MNVVVSPQAVAGKPKKKLLDQVRDVLRLKRYSLRTKRTYCDWITRFIRFHRMRHPAEMSEVEMSEFLTHLARSGNVSHRRKTKHSAHSCFSTRTLARKYPRAAREWS